MVNRLVAWATGRVVVWPRVEAWRGRTTRTWSVRSRAALEADRAGPLARLEVTTDRSAWLHLSASVATDHEDGGLVLHLGLPCVKAWLSLVPASDGRSRRGRAWEYGASLTTHEGVGDEVWLFWTAGDPDASRGCACLTDKLLGRPTHASEVLRSEVVDVPLPERTYRWRVELRRDTWARPRWPGVLVVQRAHCDALAGEQIPIPGKGENDYDCGDDATSGSTFPARGVADAVAHLVADAVRTRLERGWDWARPVATEAAS